MGVTGGLIMGCWEKYVLVQGLLVAVGTTRAKAGGGAVGWLGCVWAVGEGWLGYVWVAIGEGCYWRRVAGLRLQQN